MDAVMVKTNQDRLRQAMAKKAMSSHDLCNAAGISYEAYCRIMEEGCCGIAALGNISQVLEIGTTEIMDLMIK